MSVLDVSLSTPLRTVLGAVCHSDRGLVVSNSNAGSVSLSPYNLRLGLVP